MKDFIKYDLKSSKRYILIVLMIQIVFIGIAFVFNTAFGVNKMLSNGLIANSLLILSAAIFVVFNIYYVFLSLYKDFFTDRAILTFSIPLSGKALLFAKIFGIAIFYILTSALLLVFFKLLDYLITIELLYFFSFGFIIDIMLSMIITISFEEYRFNNNKYAWILAFLYMIVIFVIGFLVARFYPLTFRSNGISIIKPIDHAFIFPLFRQGNIVYKIITPFIYYILISIILFFIASDGLSKDVDLS